MAKNNKYNVADEIALVMDKMLSGELVKQASVIDDVSVAIEQLQAAAEILEEAGHVTASVYVTNVIEKLG